MRFDNLISLTTLAALVAACGGGPAPDAATPTAALSATPVASATPVPPPTATPEPIIFTVGLPGPLSTLDPASASEPSALVVTRHLYDGLTRFAPGGVVVEPALAESWVAAPDATAYTFTLRVGVTFSTGAPFNAAAAQANVERWLNGAEAGFPYVPAMLGGFAGQVDANGASLSRVAEVRAEGADTLIVRLTGPDSAFPATLAMPAFAMVDPAAWADPAFGAPGAASAGTGPFRLRASLQPDLVELEPNPSAWTTPTRLDLLRFKSLVDPTQRVIALQVGEVDAIADLPTEQATIGESWPVRVVGQPPQQVLFLGFNHNRRPWATAACRQAVAVGLDRAALAQAAGGSQTPRAGFVSAAEPPTPDVTRAQAMWAECVAQQDAPIATPIALYAPPIPRPYLADPQTFGQVLQAQLTTIGIATVVVQSDWSTAWLPDVQAGRADLFVLGASDLNGDATTLLCPLFCGANAAFNTSRDGLASAPDDELAALLAQARALPDVAQRTALATQADALISERSPAIALASPVETWAIASDWQGEALGPLEALFTHMAPVEP